MFQRIGWKFNSELPLALHHFFQLLLVVDALAGVVAVLLFALAHGVLDDVALEEASELFWRQDGLHDMPWLYGHVLVMVATSLGAVGGCFGFNVRGFLHAIAGQAFIFHDF
jgi:hypothetical protein